MFHNIEQFIFDKYIQMYLLKLNDYKFKCLISKNTYTTSLKYIDTISGFIIR